MTPTPNLTQASANPQRAHLTHIDFLRILAIFLVILNHGAFRIPTTGHGILGSWVIFFFNQLIKMAVPIFFMISGALLLARKESYGQLFWKRIPRFLGVIIFFWTLQWSADIFSNGVFPSPSQFLQSLYSSSLLVERVGAYVAWFLYAYLAMLLLLPLLRRLARSMRDRDYLYLFGLQLVIAALLPTFVCLLAGQEISSELCKYLPFTRPGHLPFGSGFWAVFMLMGYFLEHRIHPAILATHTGGGVFSSLENSCPSFPRMPSCRNSYDDVLPRTPTRLGTLLHDRFSNLLHSPSVCHPLSAGSHFLYESFHSLFFAEDSSINCGRGSHGDAY